MPIKLTCPSCHKNLTAPDETAGRVLKCPYCQDALTVPVGPAPPPVSPRPASPSFEPSAGPSPGRPTSFDSESPFGETVKPFPRRTHAAESPAITKTEHERIIDYFSAQGCLARFLFAMDDETYDKKVMDKVNGLGLKNKAIEKIGLDVDQLKEVPPVFLHGYSFEEMEVRTPEEDFSGANLLSRLLGISALGTGVSPTYVRIGSDGRLRTSKYDAAWLFFSSEQMFVYKYTVDMTSDSMKEVIMEYFYKDITNFMTILTSVSPPRRSGCVRKLSGCFSKPKVRESNRFMIVVPGDSFYCSISGVPDAEKAVHAMKQLMREKKG